MKIVSYLQTNSLRLCLPVDGSHHTELNETVSGAYTHTNTYTSFITLHVMCLFLTALPTTSAHIPLLVFC